MNYLVSYAREQRQLLVQLLKRDIFARYKGSFMGMAWSFVHPLIILAVYTFVFGYVFKARWGMDVSEGHATFAIVLLSGLIVFNIFAECITRAPLLIVSHANYVKKVLFLRIACGFCNRVHYRTAIYFHCGGLDLFPKPPINPTLSFRVA